MYLFLGDLDVGGIDASILHDLADPFSVLTDLSCVKHVCARSSQSYRLVSA